MAEVLNLPPGIAGLIEIMARLRDRERGCPWDIEQTFATIAPYTIEEAYEVADAIDRQDLASLKDELGDLLLQVVFQARMAQEQGEFAFDDVVAAISDKMLRRHPHVFGDASVEDADAQTVAWEELKRREREASGEADTSALAGIARGLPEWQRAVKLQKRAATVGFDWPEVTPVIAKLHEEIDEVRAEFDAVAAAPGDAAARDRLEDEIGDVLFVCANLARHGKVDVGSALRRANLKFERRFRAMELLAAQDGLSLAELPLEGQDAYWDKAKRAERGE
ncbi:MULTISPECIES: nucleoside triphosphate pyrophosphohydrolase [unclassified Lysobacter]|uniref:nucleoside triphosphate pyrophosphohydrolase n=1 Tax=unclassified Lysobacter TaxID=2635362 RepID=UPI001BE61509|nr:MULTISPECIES: nucleoside triphosphate pyrophosphohydrolase [unclassified Lysobacter]MBT2745890.1 nucleoside triphosphate pyrophosphohydrolase [Lysobacter sp. ISL-42]MBT2749551.1 nucleoside triphosphate pyrophosphohydrolase [Lysobacter sp. ISL-50]MBT2778805.1 nucleoside triphosphate pyrophosphohydrolase [Lysobacter sp. ISL-54]MBT2781401.1 nucleoside triphosphate pyrophosphohydrolase [Lysobacter sp. ISL-52]